MPRACGEAWPGCLSTFYAKRLSGTAGGEVRGVLRRRGFPREEDVMLFADWFGDFLGNACLLVIVLGGILCWGIGQLMKSAGDALQNEDVREAARIGLWAWFLSDDDDD
jgi:hypothetical protein